MGSSRNIKNAKKYIKRVNDRSYLAKDFDSFRAELLGYARTHFSDQINDFSDTSMGGLFLDMAAYIGDSMTFYLDHQFTELDLNTAVEDTNVDRLLRNAGVKYMGASPSIGYVTVFLRVPSVNNQPDVNKLPVVKSGTIFSTQQGVLFELLDDIDFGELNVAGQLKAMTEGDAQIDPANSAFFIVKRGAFCTSGTTSSESFSMSNSYVPFRTITLNSTNVSDIISVRDSDLNEYYEVESLTQDTVFKRFKNAGGDRDIVPENLEITPAPRRYTKEYSRITGKTTLRFGSGDADTIDDDLIPDPSELTLPLFGDRKTFSRFTLDPNTLLRTKTLGVSPRSTKISVRYRHGGGISHNVGEGQINGIKKLVTKFNSGVSSQSIVSVRSSIDVTNEIPSSGGENSPTLNELRAIALSYKNSQSRIVTKEDLIARIYMMPSNFGRVFRVGVRSNKNNPLAVEVAIISRDSAGRLVPGPASGGNLTICQDALKKNLETYVNEYRIIADAIDIVDARIVNLAIKYAVVTDPSSNKALVIQNINKSLSNFMNVENFQIDQPIIISDISNIILNTDGVLSMHSLNLTNLSGMINNKQYSDVMFNVRKNNDRGILFPPEGGIFEIKYPEDDIVGEAI